jgi:hypothetical protein
MPLERRITRLQFKKKDKPSEHTLDRLQSCFLPHPTQSAHLIEKHRPHPYSTSPRRQALSQSKRHPKTAAASPTSTTPSTKYTAITSLEALGRTTKSFGTLTATSNPAPIGKSTTQKTDDFLTVIYGHLLPTTAQKGKAPKKRLSELL